MYIITFSHFHLHCPPLPLPLALIFRVSPSYFSVFSFVGSRTPAWSKGSVVGNTPQKKVTSLPQPASMANSLFGRAGLMGPSLIRDEISMGSFLSKSCGENYGFSEFMGTSQCHVLKTSSMLSIFPSSAPTFFLRPLPQCCLNFVGVS